MTDTQKRLLKAAATFWVVWGLVHVLAGVLIIAQDAGAGFAAVADAIDPQRLAADYQPAVGGILNQHGWNLLWGGAVTIIGAGLIWRRNLTAIWVTALVGGLLDVGYLIFVDLPGYVNFLPGTLMTLISGTAIVLSFWVWIPVRKAASKTH